MARITMRNSQKSTFAEVFEIYISAVTARGVKDKTLVYFFCGIMSIIIVGNYSVMVSPNAKIEDKGSSSGRAQAVKEPPYFSKESGGLHWKPKKYVCDVQNRSSLC